MTTVTTLADLPLEVVTLRFSITPLEDMQLGTYPAMTIRGGLGYTLRKTACNCISAKHDASCYYGMLFEDYEGLKVNDVYVPYTRPLVIRTGINTKFSYKQNDVFQFEVILFGQAITHYDELIIAMRTFGKTGIGEQKSKFRVLEVQVVNNTIPTIIYENDMLLTAPVPYTFSQSIKNFELGNTNIKVQFTTPLRLQVQGKNQQIVEFEVLVDNLLRRLNSLLYFHQKGALLDETFRENLLSDAFESNIIEHHFMYKQYKRFSTRQLQQTRIDGIEGYLKVENVSTQLLQLLYIGQSLHIGKQTIFGLGSYHLMTY